MDGFYCADRKDLGVGGWGPGNAYGVRIEKSVQIIGPSLRGYIKKKSAIVIMQIPLFTNTGRQ